MRERVPINISSRTYGIGLAAALLAACTLGALAVGHTLFNRTSAAYLGSLSPATAASSAVGPHVQSAPLPQSVLPSAPAGHLIFSAENGGMWNLYAADLNGGSWQRVAPNMAPARDPALSPDGKMLAYRSHRDGTWEIYTQPVSGTAAPVRLTRNMVYSGAPAWSPDGKRIAFESYARDDLDIWVAAAPNGDKPDAAPAVDLTEDSRAYDYGPAWSPDGKWIAFTSWRTGTQQVFAVSAEADCTAASCRKTLNLSQSKSNDLAPAWSPDGKQMAFVSDRDGQRAIYIADFSTAGLKNARRVTFSGWDDLPAWSPDGKWLAFISARPSRQPVYVTPVEGGIPRAMGDGPMFVASVAWSPDPLPEAAEPPVDPRAPAYTFQPDLAAANSGHPYDLRRITSTRLDPGINKLNGRVADSFVALQARIKQEVGYDFLNLLSDMNRPLDYRCDITCDTLSWHKAGRAFDSRLDYTDARGSALEIVREDQQGETFWRVFLRTTAQDGTQGEPMKQAPWDLGYRARWIVGRGDGGVKKNLPYGFYVDLTELAREYDWTRISSHDEEDFDWRTNKIAAEYWHFQRMQGIQWYPAMREVYSESDLKALADWNALASQGYEGATLFLKGIPAPARAWRWFVFGP